MLAADKPTIGNRGGLLSSSVWSASTTTSGVPAEAASQMRALAADERFAARKAELQDIASVLEHPDQSTEGWEHANLIQAFPPDSTIRISSRRLIEKILGVLAAVFVFAPIAWTWFSLSEATTAYQKWITDSEIPEAGLGKGPASSNYGLRALTESSPASTS